MMRNEHYQWVGELLSRHRRHESPPFDFELWQKKYPDAARLLRCGFEGSVESRKTAIWDVGRLIMKRRATKYSVAAVVAFAVALVLLSPHGVSDNGGVALAAVKENLESVDTIVYRTRKTFWLAAEPNISLEFDSVEYMSKEHGFTEKGYFSDTLAYVITVNFPKKQGYVVLPIFKAYLTYPCTDEQLEVFAKLAPDGLLDAFLECEHKELGVSIIEGVETEGFVIEDIDSAKEMLPKFLFDIQRCEGSVWIGVDELLPIRIEADVTVNGCLLTAFTDVHMREVSILEDYNVELDEELFAPDIPEDYTPLGFGMLPFGALHPTQ
jgi:hypothetical protein